MMRLMSSGRTKQPGEGMTASTELVELHAIGVEGGQHLDQHALVEEGHRPSPFRPRPGGAQSLRLSGGGGIVSLASSRLLRSNSLTVAA